MHLLATAQLFIVDTGEEFFTQLGGNRLDLFDQRLRWRAQGDFLGAAIFRHRLSTDQALGLETVEQPGQSWPFDSHTLRQLTLGRQFFKARQVQEHQPTRL
ncbi:hypothetical protein D3C71_1799670 [compost metagenome]